MAAETKEGNVDTDEKQSTKEKEKKKMDIKQPFKQLNQLHNALAPDRSDSSLLCSDLTIRVGNAKWAQILVNSVSVDKLVSPDNLYRQIRCNQDTITVHFQATQWKWLRVGVQSFYDNLQLCLQTIRTFENYE